MVGTRYIDFFDENRDEVLGKRNGKRRIAIRFYYPGVETKGAVFCDGLTPRKKKWYGRKPDLSLYEKRIRIYKDLEVVGGSFPLILFSHGYGGYVEQNNDLCQYLANHGYIVASIGHPYEASETVYTDGTSVTFDNSLYFKMFKPFIPAVIDVYKLRAEKLDAKQALERFDAHQKRYEAFMSERAKEWRKDDLAALEKIRQLNEDETSFLYHKIDFSKGIGASGHSFGGALAYHHCLFDEAITCGVNIDGGLFGDFGTAVNHKPFLQIDNKSNLNVVSRAKLYHDKPVHFIIFKDIEHNGFCDLKLVSRSKASVGTCDPEKCLDTLNEVHVAFFDRYLKNKDVDNKTPLEFDQEMIETYEIY